MGRPGRLDESSLGLFAPSERVDRQGETQAAFTGQRLGEVAGQGLLVTVAGRFIFLGLDMQTRQQRGASPGETMFGVSVQILRQQGLGGRDVFAEQCSFAEAKGGVGGEFTVRMALRVGVKGRAGFGVAALLYERFAKIKTRLGSQGIIRRLSDQRLELARGKFPPPLLVMRCGHGVLIDDRVCMQ